MAVSLIARYGSLAAMQHRARLPLSPHGLPELSARVRARIAGDRFGDETGDPSLSA